MMATSEDRHVPPVPAASLAPATLKERLVSTALWGVGLAFITSTMPPLAALIAAIGSDRTLPLQRWYAGTQLRLTGSTWRAVVSPKVDPARGYMFSQNHTNHFDHVFMHNATPHYKCGLELESHFKHFPHRGIWPASACPHGPLYCKHTTGCCGPDWSPY